MKKVQYIGQKLKGITVQLPIGCQSRSAFKGSIFFAPFADMQDADADALVSIDPNFKIFSEEETPKKRGPKKKVE